LLRRPPRRPLALRRSVGTTTVTGSLGSVNATAGGVATLFLGGVRAGVALALGGNSNAFVQQGPGSTIAGVAAGLNTVQFSGGACSVQSSFPAIAGFALPVCAEQAFLTVPPPAPVWSCGVNLQGNFSCAARERRMAARVAMHVGHARLLLVFDTRVSL
jgi:hypothetical protein